MGHSGNPGCRGGIMVHVPSGLLTTRPARLPCWFKQKRGVCWEDVGVSPGIPRREGLPSLRDNQGPGAHLSAPSRLSPRSRLLLSPLLWFFFSLQGSLLLLVLVGKAAPTDPADPIPTHYSPVFTGPQTKSLQTQAGNCPDPSLPEQPSPGQVPCRRFSVMRVSGSEATCVHTGGEHAVSPPQRNQKPRPG